MNEFASRVALITGAGRGTGREIARAFASLGVAVAVNDINPLNLDETIQLVGQAGGVAAPFVFDVAKRMPIEGMVAQVLEQFGRIDFLVNHATVHPDEHLLEMDEWEFHRTLDVNLGGPFFCMQQVGRVMQTQGGGSIINVITFPQEDHFRKGYSAIAASQSGLLGLTQVAALELASYHIRVNAVCSGVPLTGMALGNQPGICDVREWFASQPGIYLSEHPDLVGTVLYLCTAQAASLSGQIFSMPIDQSAV